jgi:hypothetical protein
MGILDKIKSMFGFFKPVQNKLTQEEMFNYINKEYHFTLFEESLVDEIYSKMIEYGSVKVKKESKYKYVVEVTNDKVTTYEITQKGFSLYESDESE